MVYKKYIKKDGKLYGPYVYQSRRVDGKVVSEYCGTGKLNYKKIAVFVLGVFILITLAFSFFNFKGNVTGNAVLSKQLNPQTENVKGDLSILLKQGELIPSSSKVLFETAVQTYAYNLSDLILDEQSIQGNYYIEKSFISGSGEGYGLKGEKIIHPKVFFTLILKQTGSKPSDSSPVNSNPPSPASPNPNLNTPPVITSPANISDNESDSEENATCTEDWKCENWSDCVENEQTRICTDLNNCETTADKEESQSCTPEPEAPEEEVVNPAAAFLSLVSKFFLGLGITGKATDEDMTNQISGEISADNPFTYNLKDGETLELVSGSVRTDSATLRDDAVKISINGNQFLAETDYSESKEGFGKDYLGDREKIIYFNTPQEIENKEAIIKVLYNDEQFFSLTGKEQQEANLSEPKEILNQSGSLNKSILNITVNATANLSVGLLTEEERQILLAQFENISVQTVKSELFNGRYVIGYELGEYKIEYSYDASLNESILKPEMEKDRIKWLRNIISKLSEEESVHEEVGKFVSNFSL